MSRHEIRPELLCGLLVLLLAALTHPASAQYDAWRHHGAIWILTTPDGADLRAGEEETDFPALVRLNSDFFPFAEAKPDGADLRFSLAGKPLAYQIDEWNAEHGEATIWVRIPKITGNAALEITAHWGNPAAASESSGAAVFSESNGYLSVWHLGAGVTDEVGTVQSKDNGTTATAGVIGGARHFSGGHGIFCGDKIDRLPAGADPHTTEGWFRIDRVNGTIIGWGNEGGGAGTKVRVIFESPPQLKIDCDFADVHGKRRLPLHEWVHFAYSYEKQDAKLYVNGELDDSGNSLLKIKSPGRLWLGGWYDNYDFIGDLDEVRISKTARSADWIRLEYQNQKPAQMLTGPLVSAGAEMDVTPASATVPEGGQITFAAKAGGARKIVWSLKRGAEETAVATDCLHFTLDAGRVSGDSDATVIFKTITSAGAEVRQIPVHIQEKIPDPEFTLSGPAHWDGRSPLEIAPHLTNLAALNAQGAERVTIQWKLSGLATVSEIMTDRLVLQRAQNSGVLVVSATLTNGGAPVTRSMQIQVTEPERDAWVAPPIEKDEKPVDGQFYARDDRNEGTLRWNGTANRPGELLTLNVIEDGKPYKSETVKAGADGAYAFSVKLKPGLTIYSARLSSDKQGVLGSADNLVCGDAYLIDGQSNALATDTSEKAPAETNLWIRSYMPAEWLTDKSRSGWCLPVWKSEKHETADLGWWGMELAKQLVASENVPICIINAAAGGTRIDQHQRDEANPANLETLYGRMLWRVQKARLTHGIRAILWHQGENNQGAASPTGDYDWKSYQDYFISMSSGWARDFPNTHQYYVFQIWPNACAMAGNTGAGDRIREIQRTLPQLYSHMGVMSTLGIKPTGGCHFPLKGWAEFARLIQPLIERDLYGKQYAAPITPPNVKHVRYAGASKDSVEVEFDQPVAWETSLIGQFYLDGEKDKVSSGSLEGNVLTLRLKAPSTAKALTYLKESSWNPDFVLYGVNGIAALSFCGVEIETQ